MTTVLILSAEQRLALHVSQRCTYSMSDGGPPPSKYRLGVGADSILPLVSFRSASTIDFTVA